VADALRQAQQAYAEAVRAFSGVVIAIIISDRGFAFGTYAASSAISSTARRSINASTARW
jgi:hypothetical protein